MQGGLSLWDVHAGRIGIKGCSCREDRHYGMFLQGDRHFVMSMQGGSALWDVDEGRIGIMGCSCRGIGIL